MKWLVAGVVAMTVLGVVPLLGLPGAILLGVGAPVCAIAYGDAYATAFQKAGPGIWSIALLLTIVWPWALLPVWCAMNRTRPFLQLWARLLLAAAAMLVWTNLLDLGAAAMILAAAG